MTINQRDRDPELDKDMCKAYLKQFDGRPAEATMNIFNPRWRDDWEGFLKQTWRYKLQCLKRAIPDGNVVMENLPIVSLRNLGLKHMDELIELESCEVVSISDKKPFDEWIRYTCLNCGENFGPYDKTEIYQKPRKCKCTAANIVESTKSKVDSVDSQWIKIQEVQAEGSDLPRFLDCLVKGEPLMWYVTFHERVTFIGIFHYTRIKEKDGSSGYKTWFEVFGIKKEDPESSIPLPPKDIAIIRQEMQKPDYYDRLVESFAPHIWGMSEYKEAALLALASMKLKMPARILFVTDPSMGKSEILQYSSSMVPGSQHTQLSRASNAGMTVTSKHDAQTGHDYMQAGAAVKARGKILCIDEIQIGKADFFMNLNEMMESGKVRYSMAGGSGFMDANCAILMACNPHPGRFHSVDMSLGEVLEFMDNDLPQFVSRINLILMKRNNFTPEEKKMRAMHMLRHNRNNPLYMSKYYENWHDENNIEEVAIQTPIKGFTIIVKGPAPRYGTKWIKKIIKYVTNHVPVEDMTQEQQLELTEYYLKNEADVATAHNKMMTLRFLRHGFVLAQYMARLRGLSKPENFDIKRAISLMEKTMSIAALDKNGEYDVNAFNGSLPKEQLEQESKMRKDEQFDEAIDRAMRNAEDKGYFTQEELEFYLNMLPNSKWKRGPNLDISAIEKELSKRCQHGKLYEKHGQGKYTPVS